MKRVLGLLLLTIVVVGVCAADDIDPYVALQKNQIDPCPASAPCALSYVANQNVGSFSFTFGTGRVDYMFTNNSGADWTSLRITAVSLPTSSETFTTGGLTATAYNCMLGNAFLPSACGGAGTHPNYFSTYLLYWDISFAPGKEIKDGDSFHMLGGPSPGFWTDTTTFYVTANNVPEPASLVLFGSGLLGLGGLVRRRLHK